MINKLKKVVTKYIAHRKSRLFYSRIYGIARATNALLYKHIYNKNKVLKALYAKKVSVIYILGLFAFLLFFNLFFTSSKTSYIKVLTTNYMEPAQLKELIATGKDYYLIDTRSNKEYEAGHIKGAVNIPLYRDYKNVYGSQIKLKEAQAQVNRIKTFNKDVIVYSYSPNAEPMLNFVANMQKMRINIRLLSVGWNQWRNYYTTWMPGADISGEGIENYVEEKQIGPGELVLPPEPPLPSH